MILGEHFSLIAHSNNAVFQFEARFYHSAFTQQSTQAAINSARISDRPQQAQDVNEVLFWVDLLRQQIMVKNECY